MASLNIRLPIGNRPQSKGKEKVNDGISSSPKRRKPSGGASGSTSMAPAPKRPHRDEVPVTGSTRTLVAPVPDVIEVPFLPKERLLMPEAKVTNMSFLVPGVSDAQIEGTLNLPPHFSMVFQALYESFGPPA